MVPVFHTEATLDIIMYGKPVVGKTIRKSYMSQHNSAPKTIH